MEDLQKKLNELLESHERLEDDVDLENILSLLPQSDVYVAGVDPAKADIHNRVYAKDLLEKLDLPFYPDLLQDESGMPFFPVFTRKENAPGKLAEPFEWLELPFEKMCWFAAHSKTTSEIVIDPFTDCLKLPVTLVLQYAGQYAKDHPALEAG